MDGAHLAHDLPVLTVDEITAGRPFVMLVPHPDDDLLGAAMLMRQAQQRGIACGVVFLTSGQASHHHPDWPPEKLAQTRRAEALEGLTILLDAQPGVLFCDLPDGAVASHWDATTLACIAAFCQSNGAHTLITTDPGDAHVDHKAAFGIASMLWQQGAIATLWTMPVGSRIDGHSPGDMFRQLPFDNDEDSDCKLRAIDAHGTQRGHVIAPGHGFTLTDEMIEPFLQAEFFWPVAGVDAILEAPNDPGEFDALFSQSADPWAYDQAPYEQVRFARTIAALDGRQFERGLEIACAAGVLTERLAQCCNALVAVDASRAAIGHARRRLQPWPNVDIRLARMPDQFPEGSFDLIMLSDFLYYLGLRGLVALVGTCLARANPGAVIVLVNYLGPMAIAIDGEKAAEAAIAAAALLGWHPTHQERNETMRIDRLEAAR
ncbi:PIG-L family deacetylase [Novosphingobium sp.]|uniref:PIG-L family deacetylase n=1 Tax=Novosphingobium sp. TaxID=1874826 RepID=UPI003D0D5036